MKLMLRAFGLLIVTQPLGVLANPPDNVKSDALKDAVILIVRHGEKPDKGRELSPAGKARANSCVDYFKNFKVDGQPLKLASIFAAADTKPLIPKSGWPETVFNWVIQLQYDSDGRLAHTRRIEEPF